MKVLTGIYSLDAGSIKYQGKAAAFEGPKHSQEAGISIIHQELNLIPELTIAENIFLGREKTSSMGRILWADMYREADQLLARLNVKHSSKRPLGELSLGEQQMVEIAKALSFESKVIIMDEPTDALTDTETESLFKVIDELRQEGAALFTFLIASKRFSKCVMTLPYYETVSSLVNVPLWILMKTALLR